MSDTLGNVSVGLVVHCAGWRERSVSQPDIKVVGCKCGVLGSAETSLFV